MPESTLALSSLMAFAILFGLKHGFDADHLASIDGLARLQTRHGRTRLAALSGMLFSSGHGLMILLAAWLLEWSGIARMPSWLDSLGSWISIIFLVSIGIVNLRNALQSPAAQIVRPASPFARWIMRLPIPHGLAGSLLVGALFALSLDAMTIAAWFGLAGSRHGGIPATLMLALGFAFGMIVTDTLNGFLVAKLILRSEQFVLRARRLFSLLVACSALLVAGFAAVKFSNAVVDAWAEGKELAMGCAVLAAVVLGYLATRRLNQTEAKMEAMSNSAVAKP